MITEQGNDISIVVDLRSECGPVRDQGSRPTCLACAASDAHAFAHSCRPLSAEYLFYSAHKRSPQRDPHHGLTLGLAANALQHDGQPSETEWPYSVTLPAPWLPPLITTKWYAKMEIGSPQANGEIANAVRAGSVMILGIRLTPEFWTVQGPEFVIHGGAQGFGGHAILVVGLGKEQNGGELLLIRNTWGTNWANGGYAWLEQSYLQNNLIGFSRVVCVTGREHTSEDDFENYKGGSVAGSGTILGRHT